MTPTLAVTKRVKSGGHFKGGIVAYEKVKNDVKRLLQDTSAALVTIMLDLYHLPTDFPGQQDKELPKDSAKRVIYLEEKFKFDINHPRFVPYLALHEFEAMLFVSPEHIAQAFPEVKCQKQLEAIKTQYGEPEKINLDNPPSKRLMEILQFYQKTLHGPLITIGIGIEKIRQECPHFAEWVGRLEALKDS